MDRPCKRKFPEYSMTMRCKPKLSHSQIRKAAEERAWESVYNGPRPWWNTGRSHMNASVSARMFHSQGLHSLLYLHQCL